MSAGPTQDTPSESADKGSVPGDTRSAAPPPTPAEQPLIAGRYRVTSGNSDAEQGIDITDGTPVLVWPAPPAWESAKFLNQANNETIARLAASLETPWVLPVLLWTPRVVFAAPPPDARPAQPLATADAVECLLQLCDVLARAHAAGIVGFGADRHDVRVHQKDGAWRITVVLPHLPSRGRYSHAELPPYSPSHVRRDLWTAASFFRDLLLGREPEPYYLFNDPLPPLPPFGDAAAHAALSAVLSEQHEVPGIADAASLAERVLHLSRTPADWQSRVAAMPRVSSAVLPRDWDRLIELGTAELAAVAARDRNYVVYPLAAAYHQRASVAHARGDLDSAMRDVEQALSLDRWARYLVTRGLFREARGDHEGALADYDEAIPLADATTPPEGVETYEWSPPDPREPIRAHYTRGVARYRKGDVAGACDDLHAAIQDIDVQLENRREVKLPPDATLLTLESAARRAYRTVLRAMVRAHPGDMQWRWALARNLRDMGLPAEARAEADAILSLFPDDSQVRKRYDRLFPS